MNILAHTKGMDGNSYHRVYLPNHGIENVRFVSELYEADLEWCDILMYSRHLYENPDFLDKMRKQYGFKIIVDTDDWWETDPSHPKHVWWNNSGMGLHIRQHLINADAVTCTGEYLASLVPNRNVYILPNTLPYGEGQFAFRKPQISDRIRIVYASTIMNYKNTELVKGAMKQLTGLNIEMVIAGYTESPLYDEVIDNLTAGGKIPYKLVPWAGIHDYMLGYEGEIGIIPSKHSKFNRCKSNLKVLEFASQKMPVVCSPFDPYKNLPIFYAANEKEWINTISDLVESPTIRQRAGQSLASFCHLSYWLDGDQRKNMYEQILQRSNSHSR